MKSYIDKKNGQRRLEKKLVELLTEYMRFHYGNPATGRMGVILDGPVIASLSAAASLHALLKLRETLAK